MCEAVATCKALSISKQLQKNILSRVHTPLAVGTAAIVAS